MRHLIDVFESLSGVRVALVGDFMLDRYVYGDSERISPEAPVPVLRVVSQESRPGGAGSVAMNIVALGGGVSCVGLTGRDAHGDELVGLLDGAGAETAMLTRLPDKPTTVKQRLIGLAQHRHRQQMLRLDVEADGPPGADVAKTIRASLRSAMASCQVVALEDYDKGVLTDQTAPALIADARSAGRAVIVDPARIDDYGRYRGATLLTPNRFEAELASGIRITDDDALARAARRLLDATDAEAAIVTLDREGAYLARHGADGIRIPTRERKVYDVSGAGDAVLAMLAVAVAGGADLADAAALANVAGGVSVGRFGVVPVTRAEVLGELLDARRAARGKVLPRADMAAEAKRLIAAGKRLVFTNGCFDILHAGHVQYLSFARDQGDVLIVGLNSDDSVRRMKGPSRPVVAQADRAKVLAALESVDYVCVFDEDTPAEIIDAIAQGPITLVKGEDWRDKGVVGRETVERRGGRVVLASLAPGRSSSDIIAKIRERHGSEDT